MKYDVNDKLVGVVGIHVDDLLGGCANEKVIAGLRARFKWGSFSYGGNEFAFLWTADHDSREVDDNYNEIP